MISKKKEICLLLISFFLALPLGILFLEFYFQIKYSGTHNKKTPWFAEETAGFHTRYDSQLGWVTIANQTVVDQKIKKYIRGGKTYTTNAFGFRSREKVNTTRNHILAVGDSVTWGSGVDDHETMPYFLEREIKVYQVLNLGVPGYGLAQEYLYLKRNIGNLSPKWIVITIYTGNDISDTSKNVNNGKSKPLFIVDREQTQKPSSSSFRVDPNKIKLLNPKISEYSCANIFSKSWVLSITILREFKYLLCDIKTWEEWEMKYVIISIILKTKKLATKYGSKTLFVLTPSKSDFIYKIDYQTALGNIFNSDNTASFNKISKMGQLIFQDIFKQLPVEYIDFYMEIKNRNYDLNKIYTDNMHFSSEGNRLLAEAISHRISELE